MCICLNHPCYRESLRPTGCVKLWFGLELIEITGTKSDLSSVCPSPLETQSEGPELRTSVLETIYGGRFIVATQLIIKKNIYRSGGGKRCIFTKLEMFKYIKLYYNSEMIEHLKMILIHLFLQRLQCFWMHIPVKFLESKDKGYLEFK